MQALHQLAYPSRIFLLRENSKTSFVPLQPEQYLSMRNYMSKYSTMQKI
jgi:hypothetical protein